MAGSYQLPIVTGTCWTDAGTEVKGGWLTRVYSRLQWPYRRHLAESNFRVGEEQEGEIEQMKVMLILGN